jgi:hypothetical protein
MNISKYVAKKSTNKLILRRILQFNMITKNFLKLALSA